MHWDPVLVTSVHLSSDVLLTYLCLSQYFAPQFRKAVILLSQPLKLHFWRRKLDKSGGILVDVDVCAAGGVEAGGGVDAGGGGGGGVLGAGGGALGAGASSR